jgi:hypothetical protein
MSAVNLERITGLYVVENSSVEKRKWSLLIYDQQDRYAAISVNLTPGLKVADCLSDFSEQRRAIRENDQDPRTNFSAQDVTSAIGMFRWLANLVLYCTYSEPGEHWIANKQARKLWERAQRASGKKRQRLFAQYNGLGVLPRYLLGKRFIDRSRETSTGLVSGMGSPLQVRTRVAGHWRRQPCGEGRQDRKIIHVESYWRGPEDGVLSETRHKAK